MTGAASYRFERLNGQGGETLQRGEDFSRL